MAQRGSPSRKTGWPLLSDFFEIFAAPKRLRVANPKRQRTAALQNASAVRVPPTYEALGVRQSLLPPFVPNLTLQLRLLSHSRELLSRFIFPIADNSRHRYWIPAILVGPQRSR